VRALRQPTGEGEYCHRDGKVAVQPKRRRVAGEEVIHPHLTGKFILRMDRRYDMSLVDAIAKALSVAAEQAHEALEMVLALIAG
jgi:hypothetical protein